MIVHTELLHKIAEEKKHTFISTGMSTYEDIDRAVAIFRGANCPFELMHTVSTYPMKEEDANLLIINTLREKYNCSVGYSGHEVGLAVSYAAAAISGGDPLKTGLQAIWYSLRTGILPIVFLFNHELLLIGVDNIWKALLVIITSLIGILVFTAATQRWFINKLSWYEIIAFLIISLSFLAPDFVLSKFYPKFNEQKLSSNTLQSLTFDPSKDVHIKVTRYTEYGERYKLFVIDKGSFKDNYNLEEFGLNLIDDNEKVTVDKLNWKGKAKKSGIQMGDVISNFKIENPDRPNKSIIYPFALILLFLFGFTNFKFGKKSPLILK